MPGSRIAKITIRSGTFVDSIATTYAMPDGTSQICTHGGDRGTATDIELNLGEQIIAVVGHCGDFLDSITFLTEDSNGVRSTYGPFGGDGGDQFVANGKVEGFFGRSGDLVDSIGFFVS